MLNDCQGLVAKLLLGKTALNGPVPCVPSPLAQACEGEDILYIFLTFPGHFEFWTPLQIPSWGPPLGCTLLQRGTPASYLVLWLALCVLERATLEMGAC